MGALHGPGAGPPGAAGDDFGNDLLPAAGLVTSSEDYYPTVAINALMRVLRDPALASQHQAVISSLMQIFKALGTASVPYLPKVCSVFTGVKKANERKGFLQLRVVQACRTCHRCVCGIRACGCVFTSVASVGPIWLCLAVLQACRIRQRYVASQNTLIPHYSVASAA
jgi:hypothetical protein